jgi:hypothetical protein
MIGIYGILEELPNRVVIAAGNNKAAQLHKGSRLAPAVLQSSV